MPDYYNLLGVPPDAPPEVLRKAYRDRAKAVHPDAHPDLGPAEREALRRQFIQLAQAYETLSDPTRRARYDRRHGTTRAAGKRRAGPAGWRSTRAGFGRGTTRGTAGGERAPGGEPHPGLDDLLRDVEDLLGRFGLDVRPPFEALLESLLDWARAVFRQVMEAWEDGAPGASKGERKRTSTKPGAGRRASPDPRDRPYPGADARPGGAKEAARVNAELEALRRRVHNRPAAETDVEAELRRLKAKLGREN